MDREFILSNLLNFVLLASEDEKIELDGIAAAFNQAGFRNCWTLDNVGFVEEVKAGLALLPDPEGEDDATA